MIGVLAAALAFAAEEPWIVLKPDAVLLFGHNEVPLQGESAWSAQRTPLAGPDVRLHTEPGPIPDNPHCNPLIVTPGMELNGRVKVADTVEVVTATVKVRHSAESVLEVLPGASLGRPGLDGRTVFYAGDVRVSLAQEVSTGSEYRPGRRTWEVGDSLRGSGPVSGQDESWEIEGGRLAKEIQPLLVEMRTSCVHAVGLAADPVTDLATWNTHLNEPVEPVEAEVWVIPKGTLLSWPDGTPAGEAVDEVLLPVETSLVRQDRRCGVFGLRHYVDPEPEEAVEICWSDTVGTQETRSSTLLVPKNKNDRSTALLKRFPMRHPGREYVKRGETVTCNIRGTVTKGGKLGKRVITGCGEVYANAAEAVLARWRWNRPVVNGQRVTFEVAFSVDFPPPD